MAAEGRRARLRAELSAEVRAAARDIIRADGAETLTLSAVARRVGVTPAALYHHFERGLPDIFVRVAEDVVSDLVRQLREASDRWPADNFAMRMVAPARVLRWWANHRRNEFCMVFGTPSRAAGEDAYRTAAGSWVRRLAAVWGPVFVELWTRRGFPVVPDDGMDPRLRRQMLDYAADTGVDMPPGALLVMLSCWRSLYGQVTLEAFGHFTPIFGDHEPWFERLMYDLVAGMGLGDQYEPPEPAVPAPRG